MVVGWQIQVAPVVIVWYVDGAAVDDQSNRLRELTEVGALGFGGIELRKKALEEQLIPFFSSLLEGMKAPGLNELDCGQGIARQLSWPMSKALAPAASARLTETRSRRP